MRTTDGWTEWTDAMAVLLVEPESDPVLTTRIPFQPVRYRLAPGGSLTINFEIDHELRWVNVPVPVVAWGVVNLDGDMIWWQSLAKASKGDTVEVVF